MFGGFFVFVWPLCHVVMSPVSVNQTGLFVLICVVLVSSLLDDPDTQVTMKTLGLMRNLLSGREVTSSFVCSFFKNQNGINSSETLS